MQTAGDREVRAERIIGAETAELAADLVVTVRESARRNEQMIAEEVVILRERGGPDLAIPT